MSKEIEEPVKVKIKSQREGVFVVIKARVTRGEAIPFADELVEELRGRGFKFTNEISTPVEDKGIEAKEEVKESELVVPICPTHNVQLILREGQYGQFWACPTKNPDGSWCKWRPKKEKKK